VHPSIRQWLKPAAYLGLASFSCLLYTRFTPPILTPQAASRLPLIGALPGDLPGYWARFILSFALLGLAPAALVAAFREKPATLGLSLRAPILRSPIFWLAAPAAVLAGAIGAMASDLGSYYPYSRDLIERTRESGLGPLVGHLAAYALLYYVPWEFFFRGFLLFPFALAAERALGLREAERALAPRGAAAEGEARTIVAALVLFQTIPSTMLHVGHPLSELAGAVVAGLAFGILAWKTRSIVPGLILHAALGIGTDGFIVLRGAGYL
jgi:membrane protease YdiL (CAAX protease family)